MELLVLELMECLDATLMEQTAGYLLFIGKMAGIIEYNIFIHQFIHRERIYYEILFVVVFAFY
jgi:hypothetical protein